MRLLYNVGNASLWYECTCVYYIMLVMRPSGIISYAFIITLWFCVCYTVLGDVRPSGIVSYALYSYLHMRLLYNVGKASFRHGVHMRYIDVCICVYYDYMVLGNVRPRHWFIRIYIQIWIRAGIIYYKIDHQVCMRDCYKVILKQEFMIMHVFDINAKMHTWILQFAI
jgi:hypothetical protein